MQKANGIRNREVEFKAVIFDMDNTLFDFVEAKLVACKATVDCIQRDDDLELLEYFLKDRKNIENLNNIAEYLHDRKLYTQKVFDECCEVYYNTKMENIIEYTGVTQTLQAIVEAGMKSAVVTDADMKNANARLKKTKLMKYFEVVVAYDIVGKLKPEPDSILFALDKLDLEPTETVLVGDSLDRDITPGNKLGMVTVYASYGDRNFNESRSSAADHVIKSAVELLDILQINA
jgi:putative hydrolase of the HAD superfamily